MAILHLVHILPAYLHAAVLRHNRERTLQIPVIYRRGIIKAAHAAVHQIELHHARIFKSGQLPVAKIAKTRLDVGDVAEKPGKDIHKMAELGKERAAVQIGRAMPAAGHIVAFVAVPVAVYLHHLYRSQNTRIHQGFDPCRGRRVTVLHHTEHFLSRLTRHLHHTVGITGAERHRLFHHHMGAAFHRLDRKIGMQAVGNAYIDHIQAGFSGKHLGVIRIKGGVISLHAEAFLRLDIAKGLQAARPVAGNHRRMAFADIAAPDNSEIYHKRIKNG